MKKLLRMKTLLLLFALIAGCGNVWAETTDTFTFTGKSWSDSSSGWTGGKDGNQLTSGRGIQVTTGASGANATTKNSYENISKIVVTYSTNASNGVGSVSFQVGSGEAHSQSVTKDGGTTDRTLTYDISPTESGKVKITVTCTTNSIYVKSVAITYAPDTRSEVATIGDLNVTTIDYNAEGTLVPEITPADGLTSADYTVTWTEVDNDYIIVTEEGEYVAGTTKGETSVTVKVAPVAAKEGSYKAVEKTFTIKIVDPDAGDGSLVKPFTVAEAIEAIDDGSVNSSTDYYVTGIVSSIVAFNGAPDYSMTYNISDDGTESSVLRCYKGKGLNGEDITSGNYLEVGDKVTVVGKLISYMGTKELDSDNSIVSLTKRPPVNIASFSATTSTLIVGETSTTTVTNDVPAWTPESYTYSSDNEAVATVDAEGVITAVGKGVAHITVIPNVAATDDCYKAGSSMSVEITVNNPSHDVVFSINGVESTPVSVEEGEDVEFPEVSSIGGKTFVGWATEAIDGTAETASTVTTASMGENDITYYAVFANVTSNIVEDNLDRSTTGVTGTSYSNWSGITVTSSAVYAGQSAGGNSSIQLRNDNSNSGVITTISGGKVKKITVTWNSNTTSGRTLNVYGKNTAYTAATNLYNSSTQGTLLGTIVCGTNTELDITGDYSYIGFRSANGAMYLMKVTITWDASTYSDYCTNVTIPVSITSARYATYCSDEALDFSETGITAYTATDEETKVTLNEIASGKVPANTPVVLHKADADGTAVSVPVIASVDAVGDNDLRVSTGTDVDNMYVLAMNPNIGFYPWTGSSLSAGKVYLQGKDSYGARAFLGFEDETTGIKEVQGSRLKVQGELFDLQGRKVARPAKGLYIVNGKKAVMK